MRAKEKIVSCKEEKKVQEEEQIIEEPAVNLEVQSTEQIVERMIDNI